MQHNICNENLIIISWKHPSLLSVGVVMTWARHAILAILKKKVVIRLNSYQATVRLPRKLYDYSM